MTRLSPEIAQSRARRGAADHQPPRPLAAFTPEQQRLLRALLEAGTTQTAVASAEAPADEAGRPAMTRE